jgi:hypothetical protein
LIRVAFEFAAEILSFSVSTTPFALSRLARADDDAHGRRCQPQRERRPHAGRFPAIAMTNSFSIN